MPPARSLHALFGAGEGPSDADLLTQFVQDRDQGAFELLVWRHSGLVLRTCCAVLGDRHAAEDAVQATFLALARNAAAVGRRGTVAGWLYRVARRVAGRVRHRDALQRAAPVPPDNLLHVPAPAPLQATDAEIVRLLHEELGRLPPRYREPLLLCYLEGLTQAETARQLGWPLGTVATRVKRAKEALGRRLVRRGIAVPATVVAGLLARDAAAGLPVTRPFVRNLVEAAVRYEQGQSVPNVSDAVLKLAREVNQVNTIKLVQAVGVLAVALVVAAIGATAADGGSHRPGTELQHARAANKPAPIKEAPARPGRLTFLGEGRIASMQPDGTDLTWHTPEWVVGRKSQSTYGPRCDPTGKRVAYGLENNDRNSAVHVRTLGDDDSEMSLGVNARTWCWSPDGKRIAVSAIETPATGDPTTRTWIVDVGTKKSTETKIPSGHMVTDWSRDGEWVLTSAAPGVNTDAQIVTVMKTDGTAARRLSPAKQSASDGRFSPDGKTIVFETFDYRIREGRLYTVPVAGGDARPSGPAIHGQLMGVCWSPDGKRIASVWRRHYAKPEKNQKAEFVLRLTDPDGGNEVTVRKETGNMPAIEEEPYMAHWITMAGLDWK